MATHEFTITREFDATPERLWAAWTDGAEVRRWWHPQGFTTPVADMDVRVGGRSLVAMRAPDGTDYFNTWTYRDVVPGERLEWDHHFADPQGNALDPEALGLPPGTPVSVRNVVTLAPAGDGRTAMTITESGYDNEEAIAMSRGGLEQCLDNLEPILAAV
jgi:uncharacterized protein YndB with AHSA1/START domain